MSSDKYPFTLLASPNDLPEYHPDLEDEISFIGKTLYISGMYQTAEKFGISRVDRNRHTYILGKSGMGKSYLLENLIRSDIESDYGVAVIDPHGDLVKNLLACIPEERILDTVYIDPANTEYSLAFNPFASVPMDMRQHVAQSLVEIFKKQFMSTWTPRIEHLFRFAALAMLEYEEGTLYGLLQLITDAKFRQKVVSSLQDEMTRRFFSVEFAGFSQKYDQEAITPLVNRLGEFFADPLLRKIFTNPENKIDVESILEDEKIFLLNTSKGLLGEKNSALLGSFFLTKIEQVAMARSKKEKEKRMPFYLYVDEFQNVATESFISLFSESRKYAINITIANQYLSQIPENLIDAVLGNTGIMIMFRLGGMDAKRIAMEFQPELHAYDFLNLGLGEFYIKMSFNGKTLRPFSARSLRITPPPYSQNVEKILENNKKMYHQTLKNEKVEELHKKSSEDKKKKKLPPPL